MAIQEFNGVSDRGAAANSVCYPEWAGGRESRADYGPDGVWQWRWVKSAAEKLTFLSSQLTFLSIKLTFLSIKLTFLSIPGRAVCARTWVCHGSVIHNGYPLWILVYIEGLYWVALVDYGWPPNVPYMGRLSPSAVSSHLPTIITRMFSMGD